MGCLSVCLSGLYLAGRAFIRSTNDATYLAGNEVENVCAILSETSPLQTGIVQLISAAAIFPRLGTRMRTIFFDHVCSSPGRELVSCYFHCQSCLRARSVQNVKLLYQQDRDVGCPSHSQSHSIPPPRAFSGLYIKKCPSNYCQACACCKFELQLFVAQPSISLLYYISSAICAEGLHFSAFITPVFCCFCEPLTKATKNRCNGGL